MTVIYLDELFLLNFVVDYLLLLAAGRLSGEVLRRGWLALGAAIGAAYAAAAVLPGMGFLLHPLCKLGVAVLALLAGYGKSRRLLRVSLVFFAVSAAFGGGVFALQLLGGRGLTLQNGIFYSAMDLRLILLSAAGCYVLITLLFQRTARHSGLRRELVPAVLTLEGRRVALTALVDTGNTLTDPATGRPVMVAEGEKVGALFPDGQAPDPGGGPGAAGPPGLAGTVPPAALPGGGGGVRHAAGPAPGRGVGGDGGLRQAAAGTVPHPPHRRGRLSRADWYINRRCGRMAMNGWRLRLFVGVERLLARLGLKLPGKIMYIGGSDTLPPPLSRDEEAELIARLDGGDEGVKSQLIERNLRLVVYIARRFENTGVGIEDLISIGTIGLIKAINTYQPAKNIKLATYASRCIENEILMHLRKTANLKSEVSFDEPLNTDWDGNELLLSDILGTESDLVMKPIEADVDRQLLSDALEKLEDREREIITLRFGLDGRPERTQKEVADRLGISQSYISRLEKRIISRLKREILRML